MRLLTHDVYDNKGSSQESRVAAYFYLIEKRPRSALAEEDEFGLPHDVSQNKGVDLDFRREIGPGRSVDARLYLASVLALRSFLLLRVHSSAVTPDKDE
jgi:hypothetical protein